jgi:serine/threonine-protein kinase
MIPQPLGWAFDEQSPPDLVFRNQKLFMLNQQGMNGPVTISNPKSSPREPSVPSGIVELTLDTADRRWDGDLGAFLRDRLTADIRHARVRVLGSGLHRCTPVRLPTGIRLEIRAEASPDAEPLSWSPDPDCSGQALIQLRGGALVLSHFILHHEPDSHLEHLLSLEDAHLILSHCQFTVPPGSGNARGAVIAFRAVLTKPLPSDPLQPLFQISVDRPICSFNDSILIAPGTVLRAELGRGLVALTQCAVAAGETVLELVPSKVARRRWDVDLWLDQSTLVAELSIIRLKPWPGLPPGPDRPWLITSRNCAFLSLSDRRAHESVLLRGDADALGHGTIFWQAHNDALEIDPFPAAGDTPVPPRWRDIALQWKQFWGPNHMSLINGLRSSVPSVQFVERPRPGRVEPADLVLDSNYHPGRDRLTVGADLARQGITPRAARRGRLGN